MNKFSLLFKTYMYEKKIRQSDIAEKLGVSQNTISKTLLGDNITLNQMVRFADAVDCDLEIKLVPRNNL